MFLNPFMLLGIAAVSVPIVIHLLNKRKFTRVSWAAMRFLKVAVRRNQRRLRIEDLLLLLLRCAILALLALALARPALRSLSAAGGLFAGGGSTAVLIVDNSYSMSASDGVQTRFEQAKLAAMNVIDALPTNASVAIFLAGNGVQPVIPEPTHDLNLARQTIDNLEISDRSTHLFPAIESGIELLAARGGAAGELYLITDAQQVGWRRMEDIQTLLDDARRHTRAQVILVGDPAEQNIGVSDLRLASGLAPANQPLRFEVQLTNFGLLEATNVRVTLAVDDEQPSDEALVDRIPAGESRSVSLFARLRQEGASPYHGITAALGSPDVLPADDRRTIVVRALERVNVLLVDGETGSESRDREVYFLEHALMPVPPAEQDQYFIQSRTINPVELEQTPLEAYDAIILANVADVSDRTITHFANYLRRDGRGLIVFPGANTLSWSYNNRMLNEHAMLPASLGTPVGETAQDETFFTLAADALEHPISRLWRDPASGSVTSAHFYRYFELLPDERDPSALPEDAGTSSVIFRYNDAGQTPAVMERNWGAGKVVLFSSTADNQWNDLPVRPGLFVPLMHRVLGAIVQRQDEHLNVAVGDPFSHHVDAELLRRAARIQPPGPEGGETGGGSSEISRAIELLEGRAVLGFGDTSRAGVYRVHLADDRPVMLFAAQRDPAESDLQQLSEEDLRGLAQFAQVIRWESGEDFAERVSTARTGLELWLPLAMAALLLAAVETLAAQWFSRSR